MAQDTALQVIELQQLPIIVERLHSVKADIERRTAEATSLICTEETYKSVKDARAQLMPTYPHGCGHWFVTWHRAGGCTCPMIQS